MRSVHYPQFLPLGLLLSLLSLLPIATNALSHDWPFGLQFVSFGDSQPPPPYQRYLPQSFSHAPQIFASDKATLGIYQEYAWSESTLEYTAEVKETWVRLVDLKLGFAEVNGQTCSLGGRKLQISINGKLQRELNVSREAGCFTPHDVIFKNLNAREPILISIASSGHSPMLSNLVLRESVPVTRRTPVLPSFIARQSNNIAAVEALKPNKSGSTIPIVVGQSGPQSRFSHPSSRQTTINNSAQLGLVSPIIPLGDEVLRINTGGLGPHDVIEGTESFQDPMALVSGTVHQDFFKSIRQGDIFSYRFSGEGLFEIQLGFAEIVPTFCDGSARRVFSVSLNGVAPSGLRQLNLARRFGCKNAFTWTRQAMRVTQSEGLTITFTGVRNQALVSHILIRPVQRNCIPESTNGGSLSDHLAHSVPGNYPPQQSSSSSRSFFDSDEDGFENVRINGRGSHSHFADVDANIAGRITSYEWRSPDTNEFISEQRIFNYNFALGTTRLLLNVRDNVCSTDSAETSVTVTGSVQRGSYCYFYFGESIALLGSESGASLKPEFAKSFQTTRWDFSDLSFASSPFGARCIFFYETSSADESIDVELVSDGSPSTLLLGMDQILESTTSAVSEVSLTAGISAMEVLYIRNDASTLARVSLQIADEFPNVSFDRRTVIPVLTSLTPPTGSVEDATRVRIQTIGLFQTPQNVMVGNLEVPVLRFNRESMELDFRTPVSEMGGEVSVAVTLPNGISSNALPFTFSESPAIDEVAFSDHVLTDDSTGEPFSFTFGTSIRIGHDGNLYIGTLGARVMVLTYDMESLRVTNMCGSDRLRDESVTRNGVPSQRDILGLALDPRDRVPRPYVSTQTLFWFERNRVDPDNTAAWRNGAIDRLVRVRNSPDPSICLVFDRRIVANLPVSDHDHGVNGLEFTQNGDLLISVGGFTNSGLPGASFGEVWEAPISGAILLAQLSKGRNFNGNIKYANGDSPRFAKVIEGDVVVFAAGIRNAFSLALHSSNRLYTVDNGPNAGFGNTAASCRDERRNITYPGETPSDWPGRVRHGLPSSPFSVTRQDKILFIRNTRTPRYYGHPNFNRGECRWIDPLTDLTATERTPPRRYQPPLALVGSSVNAVIEYHAGNVFNGALRGELILSTFRDIRTYRMKAARARGETTPVQVSRSGGLSAAMNARGDIIIPRVFGGNILVLRPIVPNLERRTTISVTALTPFRHGRRGNSIATIAGYNFGTEPVEVSIGRRNCRVLSQSEKVIRCRVPATTSTRRLVDLVVTAPGRGSASLLQALWYM